MSKISVIVPIYNVAKYLPQCLDSIVNQTYTNLEIILVNDGSTDSCPQICMDYLAMDNRIVVINKTNGGLSDARNEGVKIATGDFISFVDSDDLLSLDFCQIVLQTLIQNKADLAECGFRKFETDLAIEKTTPITNESVEIYETEVALKLLMTEYFKQVVWNKIYRKEVVADLEFPVNKINEDEYWTYKVFGNSATIVKMPHKLYNYRQQEDSIMGKKYSLKRLDGLQALEERIVYMRENFPQLENLAIKMFCFGSFAHYRKICERPNIDPQEIFRNKIVNSVNKYNHFSIYRNWDLKAILWFQLFVWLPNIYVKCMKYNDRRVGYLKQ